MLQWYPGHMKKTKDLILANRKRVDVIVELIDARIPKSSQNPLIKEMIQNKPVILLMNKFDLSDDKISREWKDDFERNNQKVIFFNAQTGSTKELFSELMIHHERVNQNIEKKDQKARKLRIMVVGIPNVGKSSLINRLIGKRSARVGNLPGVTRGKQWVSIDPRVELFDTPGILWPKFENQEQARKIAMCGSIKDEVIPLEDIAFYLLDYLKVEYPELIKERYGVFSEDTLELMDMIARGRGAILKGNEIDYLRISRAILDEFRAGTLGRISLERPEHFED